MRVSRTMLAGAYLLGMAATASAEPASTGPQDRPDAIRLGNGWILWNHNGTEIQDRWHEERGHFGRGVLFDEIRVPQYPLEGGATLLVPISENLHFLFGVETRLVPIDIESHTLNLAAPDQYQRYEADLQFGLVLDGFGTIRVDIQFHPGSRDAPNTFLPNERLDDNGPGVMIGLKVPLGGSN